MHSVKIITLILASLLIYKSAQAQDSPFPEESGFYLHPGYAYSTYKGLPRYVFSFGVSKLTMEDSGGQGGGGAVLSIFNTSTSWSISAIALVKDKKVYPGLKLAADAQFMIFAAKMEMGFTSQNFFITPMLGTKIGCFFELLGGYNIVMFEGGGSGFQISVNLTLGKIAD